VPLGGGCDHGVRAKKYVIGSTACRWRGVSCVSEWLRVSQFSETWEFPSVRLQISFWWDFPTKNHQNLDGSAFAPKWVAPEDEQEPYESHRLWHDLTRALLAEDMDAATAAKGAVENAQRELRGATAKHATHFFEFRDNRSAPRI
jgi:hypothetical protein